MGNGFEFEIGRFWRNDLATTPKSFDSLLKQCSLGLLNCPDFSDRFAAIRDRDNFTCSHFTDDLREVRFRIVKRIGF